MSTGEEKQTALVPIETTGLTRGGAKSLAARDRNRLRDKEEANEWLRRGLEVQEAMPSTLFPESQTTLEYIKQILGGTRPEVAAENLGMTPEDLEKAKEAHKSMPGTMAEVEEQNEQRKRLLKKFKEMDQEAFRCFEKGHDLDPINPELLYWLADSYYHGDRVEPNEEKAVPLYRRAAEQGHSHAQHMLSDCYRKGKGVAQDHAQAVQWLRKAAEQGNTGAQYDLALAYKYGQLGVQQDAAQAVIWFRKVGEQAGRKERS
jgi:TPR repeat protein